MWLNDELVLTFLAPTKYAKAQFNSITFVKTVFSDSKGLKT